MVDPPAVVKRPVTVTVIAALTLLWVLFKAFIGGYILLDPEALRLTEEMTVARGAVALLDIPFTLQFGHFLAGIPVLIVCAIGLLTGRLWALVLMLAWFVSALLLTVLIDGLGWSLYGRLASTVLIGVLLTRERVMAFLGAR